MFGVIRIDIFKIKKVILIISGFLPITASLDVSNQILQDWTLEISVNYNILNVYQSGFRPKHSTETTVFPDPPPPSHPNQANKTDIMGFHTAAMFSK